MNMGIWYKMPCISGLFQGVLPFLPILLARLLKKKLIQSLLKNTVLKALQCQHTGHITVMNFSPKRSQTRILEHLMQ
nr:MAG TPA: hypothetical protein [Caudoviricetes sp.]